jgi:peptidoglycan/LPS O-acetylase OafA/YrhL
MLNNLQALRAFAAINVVFFHVIGASYSYDQRVTLFSFLEGWGINGVDLFFVISGFVMVYTQSVNRRSPRAFFANRIKRIVPVYWLFTAALFAIYILVPAAFREMKPDIAHFASSLFFLSRAFSYEHPLLLVGWTLEYEMLFYALFAVGICLKDLRHSMAVTILALSAAVASRLVDTIVLEFVFGMLCARLYLARKGTSLGATLFGAGVALLCASIFWKSDWDRTVVYGIPALLIVAGAASLRQTENRLLIFLGAASYSIYLAQALAIPAFYKVSSRLLQWVNADLVAVAALCASVAFGCLVYQYVEKPITERLKR